jgi:hypothetical protein
VLPRAHAGHRHSASPESPARPLRLQPGQRHMRGIGLGQ